MPELIEVEQYRRTADRIVGRRVAAVDAPDAWFLKGGIEAAAVTDALLGRTPSGTRRIGKLLLVDFDEETPTLGLRFGMTGRLSVDGAVPIAELAYGSARNEPAWVRFRLRFDDGGELRVIDPRRLGGVELAPDERRLGPDAARVGLAELRRALAGSEAPLKARLMDQQRVAGMGNLLTDETLWRAGLAPGRAAGSLGESELKRLHRVMRRTVDDLTARGGSHTGDLQSSRARGASCPRDGTPLQREQVGGRTTYWCPHHQV